MSIWDQARQTLKNLQGKASSVVGNVIQGVSNYNTQQQQNYKPLVNLPQVVGNYFDSSKATAQNPGFWNNKNPVVNFAVDMQKSTPAFKQAGPEAFGFNNFYNNNIGIQNYVPQFQAPKLKNPILQGAANVGAGLLNLPQQIYGTPIAIGANIGIDLGTTIGNKIAGKGGTNYESLKSPEIRLGYNAAGINNNAQQILGNAAGVGSDLMSAYLPGGAKAVAGVTVKQGILQGVKSGAISGGKFIGVQGALQGLSEGRNAPDIFQQLLGGAQQGATGVVVGGVSGGLFGGGSAALGKLTDAFQKANPKASPEMARQQAKDYILNGGQLRDRNGMFAIAGKKPTKSQLETWASINETLGRPAKTPVYADDLKVAVNRNLGLPDNANFQSGFVDFGAKIGKGKQAKTLIDNQGGRTVSQVDQNLSENLVGEKPGEVTNPQSIGQVVSQPLLQGKKIDAGQIPSLANDTRKILNGNQVKERGFITSAKESSRTPQPVKDIISGSYLVKSTKQLMSDAKTLIKADPLQAEQLALNPRNATDVQIGHELINHYGSIGDFAKAKQITEGMAQSGTEFGQAVQAFANYDTTTPTGALKYAQSAINKYNKTHTGSTLKLGDEQVKSLFDRATNIQSMPMGRERNIAANDLMDEVNNLIPSTIADKAITVWKAGLLTSLRTHERNLIGNTLHGVAEVAKDPFATAADKVMSLRTGQRTQTTTLRGIGSGTVKGLQSAKDIVTKGYDPEEAISKYDVRHVTWGKNPLEQGLKKYTDAVFRTLGAADKPFWNASYARSLYDQAGAEAINAGKRGNSAYIENLVKSPTEQMLKTAVKDANVATFHDTSGLAKVAQSFKQVASKNELTKVGSEIIAPFTGVPSSIAGQIVAYSPLGLTKGIVNAGKVLVKNIPSLQRQAAQEIGRGVIGTGLLGIGAYLSSKGLLTGQPKDTAEAAQWQLEGKQANSVLIGGKWRSIGSIGPENLVALAGAKAQEEFSKGKDASLGSYGANIGKDFLGQTFLQGVQGPLNAITDPARYGPSYLGNQAASLVPNIIKDASKAGDQFQRENNNFKDYITNSIPVLRNKNVVKRDNLGNPIAQEPSGAGAFFDLFNSKAPINNTVVNELSRLNSEGTNATPSKLNKAQTINKVKVTLSPQQLDLFETKSGRMIQDMLQKTISSPGYQALPDELKAKAIDGVVSKVREYVKKGINVNSPDTNIKASPNTQRIADELDSLQTPQQKAALWDHYVKTGKINKQIIYQLRAIEMQKHQNQLK